MAVYISGLDPAGAMFDDFDIRVGLHPESADLVEVIHTDGGGFLGRGFGTMRPLGHLDFYPNSGKAQPRCHDEKETMSLCKMRIL